MTAVSSQYHKFSLLHPYYLSAFKPNRDMVAQDLPGNSTSSPYNPLSMLRKIPQFHFIPAQKAQCPKARQSPVVARCAKSWQGGMRARKSRCTRIAHRNFVMKKSSLGWTLRVPSWIGRDRDKHGCWRMNQVQEDGMLLVPSLSRPVANELLVVGDHW